MASIYRPSISRDKILKYLPFLYNKRPTLSTGEQTTTNQFNQPIVIPSGVTQDGSNVWKLTDTVSFSLDKLFTDMGYAKEEAYIGIVPTPIDPTITQTDLSGNPTAIILFAGFLEDISQSGYSFIVSTPPNSVDGVELTIPLPRNLNQSIYVTITNNGLVSLTAYGVTVPTGESATFVLNTDTWVFTDSPNTLFVPGADGAYLDNVGTSYGVLRTTAEADSLYKKRIRAQVVGNKVTVNGIDTQINTVFNFTPAIYEWYPTSYTQMIADLTPNFCAFDLDGNPYNIAAEPNYPNFGPAFTFYAVLPSSILDKYSSGVYAGSDNPSNNVFPSSFYGDGVTTTGIPPGGDPQIGVGRFGGFFNANTGEITISNLQTNKRILQIIKNTKAAGSKGILVLQNCE